MIKAVTFDFDNTLGDRDEYAYRALMRILDENTDIKDPALREAIIQDCMIWDMQGTFSKYFMEENLKKKYGITLKYEDFVPTWLLYHSSEALLYPDSLETLKTLKERGYLLGLISDGNAEPQRRKIQRTNIEDLFDVIVIGGECGYSKPAREAFELCLKQLGVRAEEAVHVGDIWSKDVYGALQAGMKAVWMTPDAKKRHRYTDVPEISQISELLDLDLLK